MFLSPQLKAISNQSQSVRSSVKCTARSVAAAFIPKVRLPDIQTIRFSRVPMFSKSPWPEDAGSAPIRIVITRKLISSNSFSAISTIQLSMTYLSFGKWKISICHAGRSPADTTCLILMSIQFSVVMFLFPGCLWRPSSRLMKSISISHPDSNMPSSSWTGLLVTLLIFFRAEEKKSPVLDAR